LYAQSDAHGIPRKFTYQGKHSAFRNLMPWSRTQAGRIYQANFIIFMAVINVLQNPA